MAEKCFYLETRNHQDSEGIARAHFSERIEYVNFQGPFPCSKVEVISTQAAVDLAITKHGESRNDVQAIETVVRKYMSSKDISPLYPEAIRLAEGLEINALQ